MGTMALYADDSFRAAPSCALGVSVLCTASARTHPAAAGSLGRSARGAFFGVDACLGTFCDPARGAVAVLALVITIVWRMPLWPRGTSLCWTGSQWCLGQGVLASEHRIDLAQLAVLMDGQSWLLLQAQRGPAPERCQWLLVARASNPERWLDIRRVLYSSFAAEPQDIHPV